MLYLFFIKWFLVPKLVSNVNIISLDLDVDGKIILELILWEMVGNCVMDASESGQRLVMGSCKHGNEPSGSIKGEEFLD
jgi:hypothetical protein